MSRMRNAFVGLVAAGALLGGVAVAGPSQAANTERASEPSQNNPSPGDTCWVAHNQAPVYRGPHINSGVKMHLHRQHYVIIGADPDLIEVIHAQDGYRLGYMQQNDLDPCITTGG